MIIPDHMNQAPNPEDKAGQAQRHEKEQHQQTQDRDHKQEHGSFGQTLLEAPAGRTKGFMRSSIASGSHRLQSTGGATGRTFCLSRRDVSAAVTTDPVGGWGNRRRRRGRPAPSEGLKAGPLVGQLSDIPFRQAAVVTRVHREFLAESIRHRLKRDVVPSPHHGITSSSNHLKTLGGDSCGNSENRLRIVFLPPGNDLERADYERSDQHHEHPHDEQWHQREHHWNEVSHGDMFSVGVRFQEPAVAAAIGPDLVLGVAVQLQSHPEGFHGSAGNPPGGRERIPMRDLQQESLVEESRAFGTFFRGNHGDESGLQTWGRSFFPIAAFRAGTCSSSFSNLTPVRLSRIGGSWAMI